MFRAESDFLQCRTFSYSCGLDRSARAQAACEFIAKRRQIIGAQSSVVSAAFSKV